MLFTDIVGSTELASRLGDRRWRQLLGRHHAVVRRALKRFHGREMDTAGDGFFAIFDRPAEAVLCAAALVEALKAQGIDIRAGLHMGECEVIGGKVGGIAVHIGARIAARAEPGEILVSGTVKDLVSGSDIRFEDGAVHQLKGVTGEWHLFRARAPLDTNGLAEEEGPERRRSRGLVWASAALAFGVTGVVLAALFVMRNNSPTQTQSSGTDAASAAGARAVDLLVRVDPATGRVTDSIKLKANPSAVAVGEGSAWVANTGDDTISRIDPVTGHITATINVGKGPASIAVGGGSVWVGNIYDGSVSRIDPATNSSTATIDVGSRVTDLAVGDDAVWVLAHQIVRIDLRDNAAKILQPAPGGGAVVAAGHDSIWVGGDTGILWRVDPADGRVIKTLSIHRAINAIVVMGERVWVATQGTPASVLEIDAATDRVIGSVAAGAGSGNGYYGPIRDVRMAPDGPDLWITDTANGSVSKIITVSETSGSPVAVGRYPTDVAVGLGSIWVTVDAPG